jgi:hypothetical protein
VSKPLVWIHGEVKSPPFSAEARLHAGYLLRMLQEGERLGMPDSRPMPATGSNCHELRIVDGQLTWRIRLVERRSGHPGGIREEDSRYAKSVLDIAKRRWKQYLRTTENT